MTMVDSYHKVCLKMSFRFFKVDLRHVVDNKVTSLYAIYPVPSQYLWGSWARCREVGRT